MIVGVTGGSGFIGSWICRELETRGHTPYVLDHRGRVEHGMLGDVRDQTDDLKHKEIGRAHV